MDSFAVTSISCLVSILLVICVNTHAQEQQRTFNVMDYGATGDGKTDDTLAFRKAWNVTCSSSGHSSMVIPKEKTFFLNPVTFNGPCKASNISLMLYGTIVAPDGPRQWKIEDKSTWLHFKNVESLTVTGTGLIDGRGQGWWHVACRHHPGSGCLKLMPTSIRFQDCNNLRVGYIHIHNSPQSHITLLGCHVAAFHDINIDSPESSPNTDGIHISASTDVTIQTSRFRSGDDCISIGDQISGIRISDVYCGPGHGISIGSLGRGGSEVHVENITVTRANFSGTTNGVRIKTWQEGRGTVRDIHFSNLYFHAVKNPIIIDQHYGDNHGHLGIKSGVQISNVTYSMAQGTSKTAVAINFNCSSNVACTSIALDNIQMAPAVRAHKLSSFCNNAHGTTNGPIEPRSCLVN